MASEEQPDPLEQLFLIAHPNPERIGCPGIDVLKALTRRRLPSDDPVEKHLGECSPCFKEYLELRKVYGRAQRRRRRLLIGASFAACLAFGVVFGASRLWLSDYGVAEYFNWFRASRAVSPQPASDNSELPANSVLLTPNLLRGGRASQPNTLTMPTAPSNLELLLNTESDAYPRYSVVLQTEGGNVVANFNGLSSEPARAGRSVSIHIPSALFQPGNYTVILRGERPNGETQIANLYELVVK